MTRSTASFADAPVETGRPDAAVDPDGTVGLIEAILTEIQGSIRELRCASTEKLVRQHVSMTQVHVLWLLDHHGAMPMSRLAELLDVSFSNATGLMDRMEEHGLVERVRVPDDRRIVLVRPTEGGRQALEETDGIRRERLRTILARLDERQLRRALLAFRDVREAMAAEDPATGVAHLHPCPPAPAHSA